MKYKIKFGNVIRCDGSEDGKVAIYHSIDEAREAVISMARDKVKASRDQLARDIEYLDWLLGKKAATK